MDESEYVESGNEFRGAVRPAAIKATRNHLYSNTGHPLQWFFRLVPSRSFAFGDVVFDEKRAVALLDAITPTATNVVVAIDTKMQWRKGRRCDACRDKPIQCEKCSDATTRLFTAFDTVYHLSVWLDDVPPVFKTCYEVVTEDMRRKPYFDIDMEASVAAAAGVTFEELRKEVRKLALAAERISGVPSRSLVCESCTPSDNKFSYHIIVVGVELTSAEECMVFCKCALEEAKLIRAVADAVDMSVYSSTRQFRLLDNRKHGAPATRVKRFDETLSTYRPTGPQRNFEIFRDSLLTTVSGCIRPADGSPFAKAIAEKEERVRAADEGRKQRLAAALESRGVTIDTALPADFDVGAYSVLAVQAIEKETRSFGIDFPFKSRSDFEVPELQEDWSFVLPLVRMAPSLCVGCRRIHEAENPYIVVRPIENRAAFYCRRTESYAFAVTVIVKAPPKSPKPKPKVVKVEKPQKQEVKPRGKLSAKQKFGHLDRSCLSKLRGTD